MDLYGVASSRARRALWTLEEIGAEFTFHKIDMGKGEHRQPAFLSINPNGKVPVLVDDDITLFESGATCCRSRAVGMRPCASSGFSGSSASSNNPCGAWPNTVSFCRKLNAYR